MKFKIIDKLDELQLEIENFIDFYNERDEDLETDIFVAELQRICKMKYLSGPFLTRKYISKELL